jgi:multiple sugar transport system permease protein
MRRHTKILFNRISRRFLGLLLLAILIVWSLTPIFWNVLTSLKQRTDIFARPPRVFFKPTLEYYGNALGPGGSSVYKNMRNSLIAAFGTTALTIVVSSLAAYAFSRYRFRGRRSMMLAVLATRLLPPICAIIPLYMVMSDLNLLDTHLVLILIYSALSVPFSIWLLKSFIDAVPRELEESALVEGCTPVSALWRVTLPLAAPGMVAAAVFIFVLSWNEFIFAFMFTSVDARTMPVLMAESRGDDQFFWQDMASQATLLMLPVLALGIYLQRYMIKGMTTGAIK